MRYSFHPLDVAFWNDLIPKLEESNNVCKNAKALIGMPMFMYCSTVCIVDGVLYLCSANGLSAKVKIAAFIASAFAILIPQVSQFLLQHVSLALYC